MGKKKSKAKHHGSSSGSGDAKTSLKKAGGIVAASGIANASAGDDNVVEVVEGAPCSTSTPVVSAAAMTGVLATQADGADGSDVAGGSRSIISPGNKEMGTEEEDGGNAVVARSTRTTSPNETKMGNASSSASPTLMDDASFVGNLSIELDHDNESESKNIAVDVATVPSDATDTMQQPSNDIEPTQDLPIMEPETIGDGANSLELKSIDIENEGEANSENRKKVVRWTSTLEEVMSSSKSIKGEEIIDNGEGDQWVRKLIKYMSLRTCCCNVVHHDNSTI